MFSNRTDLEAKLIPNQDFSKWKKVPILGLILAHGECELETEFDGTNKFELECRGFQLHPRTQLQVSINGQKVYDQETVDGSSLAINKYERNGDALPDISLGDTVQVMHSGRILFSGTFKQD